jgi:succinate dehydrogenase/fumarate reductase iron-sulfur protein
MKEITFEVSRYDGEHTFVQNYQTSYLSGKTVLWWLKRIREEQDHSLTFTVSCGAGRCGACALTVNGKAVLACETALDALVDRVPLHVRIEPLRHFPLVRDLMVDWRPAMARLRTIHPWLDPQDCFTPHTGCQQTPLEFQSVKANCACIGCGICASVCPALDDEGFLEPLIFVQAQRIITDSRASDRSRTAVLQAVEAYVANCRQCGLCARACPRGLSPLQAIMRLRNAM